MKLGVVAAADPLSLSTWSGTPYYITKALQSRFPDLFVVRAPRPIWLHYLRRVALRATHGRVDIFWNRTLAFLNARQLVRQLRREKVDAVICMGNAPLSAYLASRIPTIHVSDTIVPLMRDYYVEFTRLTRFFAANARQFDRVSVRGAKACLFPTAWAADSAISDYGADPSRVHMIPWGANIGARDYVDYEPGVRADICNLVFIGVDWQRKGGDIAVAAAKILVDAEFPVKLHIIGGTPVLRDAGSAIEIHGFIDKGTERGRQKFRSIMKGASFLFVPTRHECFGMVFPEANSFGVPVISTQTGGVSCVVREGVNGHLLPIEATAGDYARLICSVWSDTERYGRLRETSRERFSRELNWNSWAARAGDIIEGIMMAE